MCLIMIVLIVIFFFILPFILNESGYRLESKRERASRKQRQKNKDDLHHYAVDNGFSSNKEAARHLAEKIVKELKNI